MSDKSNTPIQVYTLEQSEAWQNCIEQFENWDTYYLPGYAKAFQINGDGEPLLLYYEQDGKKAANVVMKRPVPVKRTTEEGDEALKEYCDFVTPYGYGGFLMDGDWQEKDKKGLYAAYEAYLRREKAVAEFVRFHPGLNNAHTVDDFYQVIDLGNTVQMDVSSKETIWANLTSKNRNMIRKALKSGVRVYWGREPSLYETFETIYNQTMDKVNAEAYYYFGKEFYQSILEDLKYRALMFYAEYEGEIIAMSIILTGSRGIHYHLSASRREFQHLAPTNLILYEAACFACEQGYQTFHLGGGLGSHKDHLYSFKKQFNRQEDRTFSIGKKIYDPVVYDRLCELNEPDPESGFFPKYRA
ncbi:MAG: GNAT family N-acetyltransferase [Clostridiales bacterium]|nr:GNAT family N-acetyltransferase [Clostridiales bacterium]